MIKYDEIENAYMYVNSLQSFSNAAAINRKTGEIYYQSKMGDTDEFPEDVESEYYIFVPHQDDLDLGRNLVFDFVSKYLPEKMSKVNNIFRERGAYRHFKDLLRAENMLEKWYEFENERTKTALLQWCKENGLKISG
jgi:hypothetical protein